MSKVRANAIKHGYRSGFEEDLSKLFQMMGVDVKYEDKSSTIMYTKPETKHFYLPDWVMPNGLVIETKGRFVMEDRKKHILIKEQYPDLKLLIVFQNPNVKIYKGSKTSYGEWCTRHGILWSSFDDIKAIAAGDKVNVALLNLLFAKD